MHIAKAPNQSGFTAQLADYFALFCFAFFFWPSTSLSLVLNNVSWLLPIHQPISTGLGDIASLGYILVKRIPKRRVSRLGERIINHPHIKSRISAFCWVIYYLSFTQLLLHMAWTAEYKDFSKLRNICKPYSPCLLMPLGPGIVHREYENSYQKGKFEKEVNYHIWR